MKSPLLKHKKPSNLLLSLYWYFSMFLFSNLFSDRLKINTILKFDFLEEIFKLSHYLLIIRECWWLVFVKPLCKFDIMLPKFFSIKMYSCFIKE